jgi:hypothetical protein
MIAGGSVMRRKHLLPLVAGLAAAIFVGPAVAEAQVSATAVLKNGQRHTGSNLAYRVDNRQVVVRTSQAEEPRIPVDDVAYVDFGGTPDPPNLNLSGSLEAVVMRDGSIVKGQVLELGHTDKANLQSPFMVIVKTEAGEERRLQSGQVARVYFAGGQPSSGSGSGAGSSGGSAVAPPVSGGYNVAGQQPWTPTGLGVRRGDTVTFDASGEVRIAQGGPSGGANPIPSAPTGALIGRIGNSAPFLIGTQNQVTMPAAGQLFLGVNDSNFGDNGGNFNVKVTGPAARRR